MRAGAQGRRVGIAGAARGWFGASLLSCVVVVLYVVPTQEPPRPLEESDAWPEFRALWADLEDPARGPELVPRVLETLDELTRGVARDPKEAFELFDRVRDLGFLPPAWFPEDFDLVEPYRRAIEFSWPLAKPDVTGLGYVRLCQYLRDQRRLAEARVLLGEGIERIDAGGGRLLELDLMLSGIESYQGNYEEAWRRIEHAEAVLYGGGGRKGITREWTLFRRHEAMLLGARGELHFLLGNLDLAAADLARERRLAAEEHSPSLDVRVLLHGIDLALALGRTDEVEERIAHGLTLPLSASTRLGLRLRRAAARSEGTDDPARLAAAADELEELLDGPELRAFDRVRTRLELGLVHLRQARLERAEEGIALARTDMAEMTREEGGGQELELRLAAIEGALAVARAAGEELDLEPYASRLAASFERWLERWERTPPLASGVGFLQHGERAYFVGETLRLARLAAPGEGGLERALDLLILAQARGSLARRAGFRARPFAELRSLWTGSAGDRGVLVYVPGPDRTELFAFDGSRLLHAELPDLARLEGPRADLEALLAVPPDAASAARGRAALLEDPSARRLARDLLPERVRALVAEWKELSVVGLELLGYVPFEFLPLDDERFLGDRLAVAYLPSLPLGAILAGRSRTHSGRGLCVVAATEVAPEVLARAPELVGLPFDEAESRRWTDPWEGSTLLRGAQAVRAAWCGQPAASALVLLAHGVHDRDLGPGLALAPAQAGDLGLFFPVDALASAWPEHVVLASCGAGRATLRRGDDGLATFAGSMLASGARSVVLGPAPQAYGALLELVARYQAHLAGGVSPAEALRRARGELPASLAHPFYSSLHVSGLGHEPLVGR